MKRFLTLVWKEWRDHRATLLALGIAAPALVLMAFLAFDDHLIQDHESMEPTALFLPFLVLMVVIAVASDLFAGEARRETLGFLVRMPSSLVLPLLAKITLYFAAMIGALVWGMVVLLATHAFYGHAGVFLQSLLDGDNNWHIWTLVAGFGGLWVTLVSCWVPRGGGAVLGGLLMLGVVALPLFMLQRQDMYFFFSLKNARVELAAAASVAALVALYLSFARGRRFGRGVWSSAWRGLAVVGVLMMGTTAWGMSIVHDLRTLSVDEEGFSVQRASLLKGGRWAMVVVSEGGPPHVWAVDLQTGAHQALGPRGGLTMPYAHADWGLIRLHARSDRRSRLGVFQFVAGKGSEQVHVRGWFDAEAGKIIKVLPFDTPSAEIDAIWEAELKEWTQVRHESGRKAWLVRMKGRSPRGFTGYAVEEADGKITRHVVDGKIQAEFAWGWVAGGGNRTHPAEIATVAPFDEPRVRVARPETERKRYRLNQVVAAPSAKRILVNAQGRLYWVDMETGKATEMIIEGLRAFTSAVVGMDGSRHLRAKRGRETVRVIVEPSTGEYRVVRYKRDRIGTIVSAGDGWSICYDFPKRKLFMLEELTAERKELRNSEGLWPLESARNGWLLARQNRNRIVRYHLETGKIEPVWPR